MFILKYGKYEFRIYAHVIMRNKFVIQFSMQRALFVCLLFINQYLIVSASTLFLSHIDYIL